MPGVCCQTVAAVFVRPSDGPDRQSLSRSTDTAGVFTEARRSARALETEGAEAGGAGDGAVVRRPCARQLDLDPHARQRYGGIAWVGWLARQRNFRSLMRRCRAWFGPSPPGSSSSSPPGGRAFRPSSFCSSNDPDAGLDSVQKHTERGHALAYFDDVEAEFPQGCRSRAWASGTTADHPRMPGRATLVVPRSPSHAKHDRRGGAAGAEVVMAGGSAPRWTMNNGSCRGWVSSGSSLGATSGLR